MQTQTSSKRERARRPRGLLVSTWQSGYSLWFASYAQGDTFVTAGGLSESEALYKARLKFDRAQAEQERRP